MAMLINIILMNNGILNPESSSCTITATVIEDQDHMAQSMYMYYDI